LEYKTCILESYFKKQKKFKVVYILECLQRFNYLCLSLSQHSSRDVIQNPQCVRTFKNNWVRKTNSWFQWNLPYIYIIIRFFFSVLKRTYIYIHTRPINIQPCQCKHHNGQSSCCARSAHRHLRRLFAGPSAWAADTLSARCAWTSCTVRPVPLTRQPSAQTSSSYLWTLPCCSWWEAR